MGGGVDTDANGCTLCGGCTGSASLLKPGEGCGILIEPNRRGDDEN
jgi:hypothetical protein